MGASFNRLLIQLDSMLGVMLKDEKVDLGVGLSVKTAVKHWRQERCGRGVGGSRSPKRSLPTRHSEP